MLGAIFSLVAGASAVDWLVLVSGIFALLYWIGTRNYDTFQRSGVAHVKPRFPFLGDMYRPFFGLQPFQTAVKSLYKKGEGHGVFGFFEFLKPTYMIRDPELLKLVTVKDFDNFMNHRQLGNDSTDPLFTKNLVNLKDQPWRDMRATLSPAFTTSKIKGMFSLIAKCAEQMSTHLADVYAKSKEGNARRPLPVDMKNLFARVANDVIATVAFGVGCDSLKEPRNNFYRMGKAITTFTPFRSLIVGGFFIFPKLMGLLGIRILNPEAMDFFDSLVHETIRERQKKGIFRPDMLQLLMQAREGKLKVAAEDAAEADTVAGKQKLEDTEISAQAIIFFFGGFETVSTALCLASVAISQHPEAQKKLQQEVDEMMEATGGKPTYEALQEMKYLDCVINESLRLYPPAHQTDRMCSVDTVLPGGVLIRKGAFINVPIIGLHHDQKYWDDPLEFRPERFNDENKHKIKPYTYMPFGVGPRICIGQRFALLEVKLALVHLLANFDLHPSPKTKKPMEFTPGFNVLVKGGYWCDLTPRRRES